MAILWRLHAAVAVSTNSGGGRQAYRPANGRRLQGRTHRPDPVGAEGGLTLSGSALDMGVVRVGQGCCYLPSAGQ